MESATCLSSCSVVLRYLVSGAGVIHGEFPLRRKNCNHLSVKNLNGSVYHYKESTSWSAPMKAPLCSGRCWRFKKSSDFESFLNVNSLHKTSIETRMFFKDSEKHYIKIFILQHILLNRLYLR